MADILIAAIVTSILLDLKTTLTWEDGTNNPRGLTTYSLPLPLHRKSSPYHTGDNTTKSVTLTARAKPLLWIFPEGATFFLFWC